MNTRVVFLAAWLVSAAAFAGPQDELAAALRARFPELVSVELAPLSPLPAGTLDIPAELALAKRIETGVTTRGKDGKPRRHALWWALKAFAPVMVARRALRPAERVQPADIALEERDIAGSGGALLRADPGTSRTHWRATRYIALGAPLRRADLEPAPEVLRGQPVRVSLVAERFVIETTGIARDDGRLGALIPVTRPGAAEPYFAEVVGEREVVIRGKP
jgi:flagella basal body P-ring formation protein FlgA